MVLKFGNMAFHFGEKHKSKTKCIVQLLRYLIQSSFVGRFTFHEGINLEMDPVSRRENINFSLFFCKCVHEFPRVFQKISNPPSNKRLLFALYL